MKSPEKKAPGSIDGPEFLFKTLAAQRRMIVKQRALLIAAHDALCDEVDVFSRRRKARASTCRVLLRLTNYLRPKPEKKEDHDA